MCYLLRCISFCLLTSFSIVFNFFVIIDTGILTQFVTNKCESDTYFTYHKHSNVNLLLFSILTENLLCQSVLWFVCLRCLLDAFDSGAMGMNPFVKSVNCKQIKKYKLNGQSLPILNLYLNCVLSESWKFDKFNYIFPETFKVLG